jgi:hypothetical protein
LLLIVTVDVQTPREGSYNCHERLRRNRMIGPGEDRMGQQSVGAQGLFLLLFAACSVAAGDDAPLADAVERADRAVVRALLGQAVDWKL